MSKNLVFVLLASLTVSSCVFFNARNINPDVDQRTNSTGYKEKYDYIESREKANQPTSMVLNPFISDDKSKTDKVAKVKRNLEVIVFCDAKDQKLPLSTLLRGKEVAWFLRKKTSSPRDIAMTDQDGMIFIPHVAELSDEIIITYGKFVSKAIRVENQNPIEVHLHCDKK